MPQSRCQTLTPGQVCKGAKTQKQPKHRTPQQGSRAGQRRPLGAAGAPSADSAHSGHPPPSTDMGRGPTALWPGLSGPAPQERETQGPSLCLPPWKDNQCNGPCRLSPWDQPVPGTERDTEEHSPRRPGVTVPWAKPGSAAPRRLRMGEEDSGPVDAKRGPRGYRGRGGGDLVLSLLREGGDPPRQQGNRAWSGGGAPMTKPDPTARAAWGKQEATRSPARAAGPR